jgi:hypothetical protein
MLSKADISALERLNVKAEDVLEGLLRVAFVDPADFYDDDGQPIPLASAGLTALLVVPACGGSGSGTGSPPSGVGEVLKLLDELRELLTGPTYSPRAPRGPR